MTQFSRTVPAVFVLLVSHSSENLSLASILSTFEALTESNQVIYIYIKSTFVKSYLQYKKSLSITFESTHKFCHILNREYQLFAGKILTQSFLSVYNGWFTLPLESQVYTAELENLDYECEYYLQLKLFNLISQRLLLFQRV